MIRALPLALVALLAAGCASKMRPVEGQTAAQQEKDRAECEADARAVGRGGGTGFSKWSESGLWLPLVPLALLAVGPAYAIQHERRVGDLIDGCMLMRGYKLPEKSP